MRKIIQNGFSILEVMIATTLIVVGLVGVMSLVNQSIHVQGINKNELIASQLAQEGLELVKNRRDTSWATSAGADNLAAGNYAIDHKGNKTLIGDISSSSTMLYLKNNFYEHDAAGTSAPFRRMIAISGDGTATSASSTVMYSRGGKDYFYEAAIMLYDWGVGIRN